jgi:hypothetical protein
VDTFHPEPEDGKTTTSVIQVIDLNVVPSNFDTLKEAD